MNWRCPTSASTHVGEACHCLARSALLKTYLQHTIKAKTTIALLIPCLEAAAFGSAEAEDSGGH